MSIEEHIMGEDGGPDLADIERLDRFRDLAFEAGKVFSPTAPIDEQSLFAGRNNQLRQVLDAVNQKGQHAMIFGERGVGKTSLSNVFSSFLELPSSVVSPRVNCDSMDSFDSVWRKVFAEVEITGQVRAGFAPVATSRYNLAAALEDSISPDTVRRALRLASADGVLPILIIDEFDRLRVDVKRVFADTIKTLSDHAVPATVILVGVADSVDELIEEHHSVERALVQIRMPRMSSTEIQEIIWKGLEHLGMTIDGDAIVRISALSQGLPHYAHLLGLHASRAALDEEQLHISVMTVSSAIKSALDGAQQSIRSACHQATMSPRKDNLFGDVLLACALAQVDDLGFFAAQDVRGPLREITGRQYEIPSFAQHLNEFCEEKRGPILQKTGTKRRYRFRFINPLTQPFVIMQGFSAGRISQEFMSEIQMR